MSPPSQKYRQIGFHLDTGAGLPTSFAFAIRPEDLTRQEPSRLTVQQTLGGAWADAFDRGISTITLAGHNGWRGSFLMSGQDLFAALRSTVFQGWHDARAAAIQAGTDPGNVSLIFTDALDSIRCVVAPRSFTLRRSRTSPLLMRYNIVLVVLDDADRPKSIIDQITDALSDPLRWLAGVTGLQNVLADVQYYATTAANAVGGITASVSDFLLTGQSILQSVTQTAQNLQGQFDSTASTILNLGTIYSVAAGNAFAALAGSATLPPDQMISLSGMSSAWTDAYCNMSNSFNSAIAFPDYSALLGASGCSSTGGGLPASSYATSNSNPFLDIFPVSSAPASVSSDAAAALATLSGDPLPLVGQTSVIGDLMARVSAGVTVG